MSKFRKPSISYSDVRRGAGTKKERALRASVVARKGETPKDGTDHREAERIDRTPAAPTPALTVVRNQDDDTARSLKEVNPEEEPPAGAAAVQEMIEPETDHGSDAEPEAEAPGGSETPDDNDEAAASDTNPRGRRKRSAPTKEREPHLPQEPKFSESETVRMGGYVHCPLPGRFDAFDKLVDTYGETKGVAAAISLGLKILEDCIVTGKSVDPVLDYSMKKERIRERRTVSAATAEWARANLDPAGVLKPYTLGGRLWKTALGLYLAKG